MKHIPVLLDKTINELKIKPGEIIVDGTLGGGGHTLEIIKRFGSSVKIVGFDLDTDAINRVKLAVKDKDADIVFINNGFNEIDSELKKLGIEKIDKFILDLGISSFQLEEGGRGFSFLKNEPLLMTMKKNPKEDDITAQEIVNYWSEESLADIIFGFGEERYSRKIARAIVEARQEKKIENTFDLVSVLEKAIGHFYKGKKIHFATKTFQALRIATNRELENLEEVINKGFNVLNKGGIIAIISFHSLEDRIVKRGFKELSKSNQAVLINKKPYTPNEEEIKSNPRSRSSKLRLIEKTI